MNTRDILVIGASAGGLQALTRLFSDMPAGFGPTVFLVQHVTPAGPSQLPQLLERCRWLPAFHPEDGEPIRPAHIHVAPPDRHLLVRDGRVLVRRGPQENRTRPAIDPLFRSAAAAFATRVVGVVLTGMLDDGASGLHAIHRCGGLTVVQDPEDADWPSMPRNAIAHTPVDHVVAIDAMAALLVRLGREPAPERPDIPPDIAIEARIAEKELTTTAADTKKVGRPTTLVCPDCGGGLSEIANSPVIHFRCQVGHTYSAETMVQAQGEAMEKALWVALRTHEERIELFTRLADHARSRGHDRVAASWGHQLAEARSNVDVLRRVLSQPEVKDALPTAQPDGPPA
ncbi:two-component system chemotaxis response regulator CheB [Azospirillum agricola]|uniref:chemotaxis protein CheB n=1 Tax=Azospirillum agricola TaxID=1720247 RepID=UPI001AEAAEAE|nr:chemotaxis protein CheB [Azospirillum agricola]MBP2231282.1 two-component system chemotaxis response regulator CheB [Azospirillum agricola]